MFVQSVIFMASSASLSLLSTLRNAQLLKKNIQKTNLNKNQRSALTGNVASLLHGTLQPIRDASN